MTQNDPDVDAVLVAPGALGGVREMLDSGVCSGVIAAKPSLVALEHAGALVEDRRQLPIASRSSESCAQSSETTKPRGSAHLDHVG